MFGRAVNTPDSTFLRIIPVSPFSRRLASFSSLRRRSYLFLISRISRSASSSICFFVSSYSRNCCRDSSLAWSKWEILSKQYESNINRFSFERDHSFHRSDYLLQSILHKPINVLGIKIPITKCTLVQLNDKVN